MEFYPGKCNLLQITNKIKPINFTYEIHDIPITKVDAAKYLGVIIDCKIIGKNNIHISLIIVGKHYHSYVEIYQRPQNMLRNNVIKVLFYQK